MNDEELPLTRMELEGFRNGYVAAVREVIADVPSIELYQSIKSLSKREPWPHAQNTLRALASITLCDELLRRLEIRELEDI